jgi:hypothetical protein
LKPINCNSLKTRGRARAVARPKSYLELFYPHENYEVSFSLSPFHRFIRSIHQFASDDHSTLHIVKEFSFSQLDRVRQMLAPAALGLKDVNIFSFYFMRKRVPPGLTLDIFLS